MKQLYSLRAHAKITSILASHLGAASSICCVLLIGCAHTPMYAPKLTQDGFWADQQKRFLLFKKLKGDIRLRFRGPKKMLAGRGDVFSELAKGMRVEIRDPLGRIQVVLSLEQENFTAYYPMERRAFLEKASGKTYFGSYFNLQFDFPTIQYLMVGILPWKVKRFDTWRWNPDARKFEGTIKGNDYTAVCYVNIKGAHLESARIKTQSDVLQVTFADREQCCATAKGEQEPKIELANEVVFRMQNADSSLRVDWLKLEQAKKVAFDGVFRMAIPSNVEKVIVQ